jgi:hypothetical protein
MKKKGKTSFLTTRLTEPPPQWKLPNLPHFLHHLLHLNLRYYWYTREPSLHQDASPNPNSNATTPIPKLSDHISRNPPAWGTKASETRKPARQREKKVDKNKRDIR